ncbi:MAG TPA: acyl-CoA dehydrogenase [Flavobacteriales bacterium]
MPIALLRSHPGLAPLLPLLTLVWSDATLTGEELTAFNGFLEGDGRLSAGDRQALSDLLDPRTPPSMEDLLAWQKVLRGTAAELPAGADLAALGIALGHAHGAESADDAGLRDRLMDLEQRLGVLGREAVYRFRQGHNTRTSDHLTRPSFDAAELQRVLDGDQAEWIARVKKALADPAFRYADPSDIPAYREQVMQWCRLLARQGFGAAALPTAFGGAGDMAAYFTILETLSHHDLSLTIKFGVQFGLWGMSVLSLGTEHHHRTYLRDIGTLALPGCFAMTETGHGSNVQGIRTTATYDPADGTFLIHTPDAMAQKEYIGNAAVHGRMATVFAKLIIDGTDHGVGAFVVPLRDGQGRPLPGITIGDCGRKMGLNGVDNGTIRFDRVRIPKADMLDRFARVNDAGRFESDIASEDRRFFTMLGTLVGGRIGIPRSALSAAKSGLTIAVRHGDRRTQFGPEGGAEVPILNYRMHQRRLMPLLAGTYAYHFALRDLTRRFLEHGGTDAREIEALAAGLKAQGTWHATTTLQQCRECCGGKGYLSENRIDALRNDTEIYTTFEGDNMVLMQLVAKGRLTAFRKQLGDGGLFSMLDLVARQARTSITEKNPIITRTTDTAHLLDRSFHLAAFRYRDEALLVSVARRLKRHIDAGMDSFDATNVAQFHLVHMAQAYIERVVLERFEEGVRAVKDPGCQAVLRKLCDLYALSRLEADSAWFQEQGYLEGVKAKAIRKQVDQLCWEIRQDAVPLVEAFGIPDELLAAPIATGPRA